MCQFRGRIRAAQRSQPLCKGVLAMELRFLALTHRNVVYKMQTILFLRMCGNTLVPKKIENDIFKDFFFQK